MSKYIYFVGVSFACLLALGVIAVGAWFMWIAVYVRDGSALDTSRIVLAGTIVCLGLLFLAALLVTCGTPMSRYREERDGSAPRRRAILARIK